jgi:ribonuclease PH
VSVGLVGGEVWLDLCYDEDSTVDVDFNCAMTADHRLVEVQGSAERGLFDRAALDLMLDVAASGIDELVGRMRAAFPEGAKYVQRDLGAREP